MQLVDKLAQIRAYSPAKINDAMARRRLAAPLEPGQKLLVLALDHPARGAFAAGSNPTAMANREELLRRCVKILSTLQLMDF